MISHNSLLYWFPKIAWLDIPVPNTKVALLTSEEKTAYANPEADSFDISRLHGEVKTIINSRFHLPVFLRTDEFSNKHFWNRSCYLDNFSNLGRNLQELIIGSKTANFIGCLPLEAIAVREYIPMDTKFHAFSGMPVNPERRYFIRDGKVKCHHPYWIEDAIEQGTPNEKLPASWKELAKEMNFESPEEIDLLSRYCTKVAQALNGYWSVDFCKAKDGRWVLIDMALGNESWHPHDCKYSTMSAPQKKEKPDFSFLIEKKE
jgi:hypothetical protein